MAHSPNHQELGHEDVMSIRRKLQITDTKKIKDQHIFFRTCGQEKFGFVYWHEGRLYLEPKSRESVKSEIEKAEKKRMNRKKPKQTAPAAVHTESKPLKRQPAVSRRSQHIAA